MYAEVKVLTQRDPVVIGAVSIAAVMLTVVATLQYDKLPMFKSSNIVQASFAEIAGLKDDAEVQIAGLDVGKVTDIELQGDRVLVSFSVDRNIAVGDRSEAAIKTKTVLGNKFLELTPRGSGRQSGPIPLERTVSPYQLTDAIGELTTTVSGLDTRQLSDSLQTLANTFASTAPEIEPALQGVARLSQSLDTRDAQLRTLIENANNASAALSSRTDKIVQLVHDSNAVLAELLTQSDALDRISSDISRLSQQISGFVADNQDVFKGALDKLNGALTIVDNRKAELQKSIKSLNSFTLSLGEAVADGPFFKTYVVNLLPGQVIQPFVEAAFSDLGLDPNVLLPSQLTDPQVGQPGTPPLPAPYPRTGQGGPPPTTLPDAITGNPGDPRYPYREPSPSPPPGGPPPGAPAPPVGHGSIPTPSPSAVYLPAPNETLPTDGGQQ